MEYYDKLETRDPEVREREIFAALPRHLEHAIRHAPYFGRLLAKVDPGDITSRQALAQLPVIRKSDLQELQRQDPPFGGLASTAPGAIGRIFASPGPIYDPEGCGPDWWRFARGLFAAGFRKGELIYNTFAYTFTPAGFMVDGGARALGCPVFPAGVGQTEHQVATIAALRPQGYVGTPSFLRILLEKGDDMKADLSSLGKAMVGAEGLPASVRQEVERRGIRTVQLYATADLGMIAYESPAGEGWIVDEGVLVEIVRPGTGEPLPEGEVGEVVVTSFNPDYPLVRFATGDLSAVLRGASPCGRTNTRIKGWMGRADQTCKVRGMFIRPSQVAEVMRRHAEVLKARLVIDHDEKNNDRMTLRCEVAGSGLDSLGEAITASIRDVIKLRGDTAFVAPGSLPNDGKVIDDLRKFE
ncbi:MAG: AMP-binding protein [Betaproteobacteria bacterium]|nr:AMP-binding protein [Betaproteobacteria bacterium]